jgi:hypothetical protein
MCLLHKHACRAWARRLQEAEAVWGERLAAAQAAAASAAETLQQRAALELGRAAEAGRQQAADAEARCAPGPGVVSHARVQHVAASMPGVLCAPAESSMLSRLPRACLSTSTTQVAGAAG